MPSPLDRRVATPLADVQATDSPAIDVPAIDVPAIDVPAIDVPAMHAHAANVQTTPQVDGTAAEAQAAADAQAAAEAQVTAEAQVAAEAQAVVDRSLERAPAEPSGEIRVRSSPPPPAYPGTPFVELDREAWSTLRASTPMTLDESDVQRVRGLGDRIDSREVEEVYLPLARLVNLYVGGVDQLHAATSTFLGETPERTPFVIGVAGSVAVGKSTTSRILRELLARWPDTPKVELVTTDGFLLPNAELMRRGLLERKGFPESYDRRGLLRFVSEVKSGNPEVRAPVYSHLSYDIVPGVETVIRRPDVLIIEGLNVLQPALARADGRHGVAVSDFFDFSIYVDARTEDVRTWYVDRFLRLRETAFSSPESYFHRYASLTDREAAATALRIWSEINERNLVENVLPTRGRATLVLTKGADHAVRRIRLRKL